MLNEAAVKMLFTANDITRVSEDFIKVQFKKYFKHFFKDQVRNSRNKVKGTQYVSIFSKCKCLWAHNELY